MQQVDSLLLRGIQYSYEENYAKAEEEFFKVIKLNSKNPAPYFLLSSLYGLYMVDFSTDILEQKFYAYTDTAISLADYQIKSNNYPSLSWLWLGGSYGIRGVYEFMNGNKISGIRNGLKSINGFSKAIEIDSSLFDAYIGVSGYNYFKYRLLSFVPWVKDSRWEHEIKMACDKGKYFRIAALACYSSLLIEEKKYNEACRIADSLIYKFPNSRTFRWLRVKSYCGLKDWAKARDEYEKLLELTVRMQPENFYNIGCCRIGLAHTYLMLGDNKGCQTQCDEIFKLPDTPRIKKLKIEARKIVKNLTNLNRYSIK
ncbi:MAG: hypothetical protein QMD71_05765 [bacterium]|nr:hypothetical protein [bacterium]